MTPRPLSPHLQSYRLPLTALLSISHRISGVILAIGSLIGVGLLLELAFAPAQFRSALAMLALPFGRILLWLWIAAFLLHLCHGLRHLLWDAGVGFDRKGMTSMALFELLAWAALLIGTLAYSLTQP